jgi:copper ion binding protein
MRREARTFRVSGMHRAGCVGKVEAALGELPGVMRVAVSLEPGLARVDFDGDRASPEAIVGAITSLGYQVETRLEGEAALDREQTLR